MLILLPKSTLNANLTTTNRFFTNDDWQRGRFENLESDHQYESNLESDVRFEIEPNHEASQVLTIYLHSMPKPKPKFGQPLIVTVIASICLMHWSLGWKWDGIDSSLVFLANSCKILVQIGLYWSLCSAWNFVSWLSGKSLNLLCPDASPRCKICPKCVCGLGFTPDPAGRAYSTHLDLAGFKRPISKGGEERGEKERWEERRWERRGRKRKGTGGEMGKRREWVILVLPFPQFEPWLEWSLTEDPLLICCQPSSTIYIFLITFHQSLI